MNKRRCRIIENVKVAQDTYMLTFQWEENEGCKAGQFFNIGVEGFFLPRPISLCIEKEKSLSIIYKVVGEGTEKLREKSAGEYLDVMGPLGNGYQIEKEEYVVLMGGGVGVPPMIELAKRYLNQGTQVYAFLGFMNKEAVFGEDILKELGAKVYISTDEGSYGIKGNVMDAFNLALEDEECSKLKEFHRKDEGCLVCACGPTPMLRAIENNFSRGYISFESRMACGIGACMACVAKDKKEEDLYHRICKEGPVFPIGRISY